MKSKRSFILKASTALVLALIMLFGTVTTSLAAVVDDLAQTGYDSYALHTQSDGSDSSKWTTYTAVNSGGTITVNYKELGFAKDAVISFGVKGNSTDWMSYAGGGVMSDGDEYSFYKTSGNDAKLKLTKPIVTFKFTTSGSSVNVRLTMSGAFSATAKIQSGTGGTATLDGDTVAKTVDGGTSVELVATPSTDAAEPYDFDKWTATPSGNAAITDSKQATTTAKVNGDVTFTANFSKKYFTVTNSTPAAETAHGELVIAGLNAENKIQWDEPVALTATPASGYYLSSIVYNDGSDHNVLSFASHDAEGYKETGSFIMPAADTTVTATFAKLPAETVAYGVVGEGYVSVGEAYNDGTEYKTDEIVRTINQGEEVQPEVTYVNYCAIPKRGYAFKGWYLNDPTCTGDPNETDANIQISSGASNGYKYYAKFITDTNVASSGVRVFIDEMYANWQFGVWNSTSPDYGNDNDYNVVGSTTVSGYSGSTPVTIGDRTYYKVDFPNSSVMNIRLGDNTNGNMYTAGAGTYIINKDDYSWSSAKAITAYTPNPTPSDKDIFPVILNVTNPEKGEENKTHVKAYCEAGESVDLYTSPKDYKKVSATQDVSTAKLTNDKTKDKTTSITMPATPAGNKTTLAVTYNDYEQVTVTYGTDADSTGTGTVTATTASGRIIPSGSTVLEGTDVTFTASADNGSWFTEWSDSTNTNPKTVSNITADTNLDATFITDGYKFVYRTDAAGNTTETNMKMLENGWYISTATAGNNCHFSIYHNGTTQYCDSGATGTDGWYIGTKNSKTPIAGKWTSSALGTSNAQDYFKNTTGEACYVVYDPSTQELWLTTESDGIHDVTVYLKDGTIRLDESDATQLYTSEGHILTCQIGTSSVVTENITPTDAYANHCHKFTVSASDLRDGKDIVIKTVVNDDYKDQYYVKGFAVNDGLTQSIITQEFDEDTKAELTNYPDRVKVHGSGVTTDANNGRPYNEFTLHLEGLADENIEITPIYFKICELSNDTIRFYADSFGGQVKKDWGGTLAVFTFNDAQFSGIYPGQPMVNEGGRYMMDIPTTDHSVTMNNYFLDDVHQDLVFGGSTEKQYHYQTYDYNEFDILHSIFTQSAEDHAENPSVVDLSDEDIVFTFKYRNDKTNHGTQETSQLKDSVQYKAGNNPLKTGQSWYGGSYNSTWDYAANHQTINPNDSIYEFEYLTDFYGNRVDMFGDHVDIIGNSVKAAYNPILAVSNGYDYNKAGDFATAWALYKPENLTGDPGTYTLFDVIGGQGVYGSDSKPYYGSESYFIDPTLIESTRRKYGADTTASGFILDLERIPVKISYEFNIQDGRANHDIDTKSGNGDIANRSDGRWNYTTSDQMLKANVIIAIKDGENYTRDYFQSDADYASASGYEPAQNTGLTTGIKAYFDNEGEVASEFETKTNTPGHTQAYALSDGVHTFNLRTEDDPEGNYEFVGWYLYNGKDYIEASKLRSYDSEARSNDVFAAVYRKVPSGKVTISHVKSSDSTGSGDCKATISIVTTNINPTAAQRTTLIEDTIDSFTVGSKYIKYNSDDYIEIVLKTEPDDNSRFDETYGFHSNITGSLDQSVVSSVAGVTGSTATVNVTNKTATIYIPIASLFNAEEEQTIKGLPFVSKIIGMGTYQFVYKDRNNEDAVYNVKVDLTADEVEGCEANGNHPNVPSYIFTGSDVTPVQTALNQIQNKIGSYKREIHWDLSSDSSSFTPDEKTRSVRIEADCPVEQFTFKYTLKGETEKTYAQPVTYNKIVTFNSTYKDNTDYHYIEKSIPRTIDEGGETKTFSYWSSDAEGTKPLTTNITFGMLITDGVAENLAEHDVVHVYAQYGKFAPDAAQWQPNFEEVKQTRKIENDRGDTVDTKYIDYLVNYINKDDKRIQNLVGSEVTEYGIVVLKGDVDYNGTDNNAMSKLVDKMVTNNYSQAKKTLDGNTFIAYRFAYNDAVHTTSFNRTLYTLSGNNSAFVNKHFTAMAYIKTTSGTTFYTPVESLTVAADA